MPQLSHTSSAHQPSPVHPLLAQRSLEALITVEAAPSKNKTITVHSEYRHPTGTGELWMDI